MIYDINVKNDCIFKNWNIKIKIKKIMIIKIIIYAILITKTIKHSMNSKNCWKIF